MRNDESNRVNTDERGQKMSGWLRTRATEKRDGCIPPWILLMRGAKNNNKIIIVAIKAIDKELKAGMARRIDSLLLWSSKSRSVIRCCDEIRFKRPPLYMREEASPKTGYGANIDRASSSQEHEMGGGKFCVWATSDITARRTLEHLLQPPGLDDPSSIREPGAFHAPRSPLKQAFTQPNLPTNSKLLDVA